jgi:ribosomal protein S4
MIEKKDIIIPPWLTRKGPAGKIVSLPKKDDLKDDINLQLVVEFYSR